MMITGCMIYLSDTMYMYMYAHSLLTEVLPVCIECLHFSLNLVRSIVAGIIQVLTSLEAGRGK